MPSSTSSSERAARRRTDALRLLALGAVGFTASVLGGEALLRRLAPPYPFLAPSVAAPDDEHFLAYFNGDLDHEILLHGLDPAARESMKAAKVLFVGSSRLMFACDTAVLRPFFEARHVSYFMLGFGLNEGDRFPLEVIRRHDLRPALAVVNADEFFAAPTSALGEQVLAEASWQGEKAWLEASIALRVQHVLHGLLPRWSEVIHGTLRAVAHRSRRDGTWLVFWNLPPERCPRSAFERPAPATTATLSPAERDAATAFQAELARRGARLILTCVPHPGVDEAKARAFATLLGVPLLLPGTPDLATVDGQHLDPESARRFATDLLALLDGERAFERAR